ncbi:MAG: DUF192 domain-containing protein [bacterium]|nr:DUF192 domain-containing protein [bacterium]
MQIIIVALVTISMLAIGCTQQKKLDTKSPTPEVSINAKTIVVGKEKLTIELRDTDTERAQGLSGRSRLEQDHGMLFDFTNTAYKRPAFWMKNMEFNIDIIWIKDNKIIGIAKNIPAPKTDTEKLLTYSPPSDIDYVLEVNAGWSDAHNITIGESITLP